ncbi:MAG: HNH endonuclease [Thermodesulfovibrionales bacterium]
MAYFITYVSEEEIKKEKAKAGKIRKSQWWKRKCADGICFYCKKKVNAKDLTLDHIVPLIRGGKSTKGNIVPACKDCNNRKKYLHPIEWEEYMESLNKSSYSL